MFTDQNKFVEYKDLRWSGILKSIKKSSNVLQPLVITLDENVSNVSVYRARRSTCWLWGVRYWLSQTMTLRCTA